MCFPQKDWSTEVLERPQTDAEGWGRCQGLDKVNAEMLLDWLEVHGFSQREVSYDENSGFTVRWRK
jgi:hypothetical protein